MLHRGTTSRIGPTRTLTSPCSMRSGKFVADLRASSGGVRDETPGRGWAGTQRHANISRAPSPLGGLGDNWSNDPPEDEAAQNGKAAAPQLACGGWPSGGFRFQPEKEERTAHPRAHRSAGAADGDLPRAERGAGAADGDLPRAERGARAADGDLRGAARH